MGFTVTGLALGYIRMLAPMAESTGKCLVLGLCFFHQFSNFLMTRNTESSWCGHGIVYLQRMMRGLAAKTVARHLPFGMRFMTLGTVGDLAVDFMAEGTGLLGMGALIVDKILPRAFMARETWLFYIIGEIQGKRLMRV